MARPSLARVQLDADLARLGGKPALLERKWMRMARSPFAFLRGASPLWAEAMSRHPALLRGLPGRASLVGDVHLENVGVFRWARGVTFHVNDFDETFEGPCAFDVLRLLTSTLLARDELHVSGVKVLGLAHAMMDGYEVGVRGGTVRAPAFVQQLVSQVNALPPEAVLRKKVDDVGKLMRNPEKTPTAPAEVVKRVPAALETWSAALPMKVDAAALERALQTLPLGHWHFRLSRVERHALQCQHVEVDVHEHGHTHTHEHEHEPHHHAHRGA